MEQTDFDGIVLPTPCKISITCVMRGILFISFAAAAIWDLPFKTHATILQWAIMSFCLMENSVLSFQYPTIFKVF